MSEQTLLDRPSVLVSKSRFRFVFRYPITSTAPVSVGSPLTCPLATTTCPELGKTTADFCREHRIEWAIRRAFGALNPSTTRPSPNLSLPRPFSRILGHRNLVPGGTNHDVMNLRTSFRILAFVGPGDAVSCVTRKKAFSLFFSPREDGRFGNAREGHMIYQSFPVV